MHDHQAPQRTGPRPKPAPADTGFDPWGWVEDHILEPTQEAAHWLTDAIGLGNSAIHDLLFGDHAEEAQSAESPTPTSETPSETPPTATPEAAPTEESVEAERNSRLPTSAAEAEEHFISQFRTDRWNPDGPTSSTNCGPASLAMMMSVMGTMPDGLSAEQQVDHARALMYPNDAGIKYIEVDGQQIAQLNEDHELTSLSALETGINASGGVGSTESGWDRLDAALNDGSPVALYGYLDDAWRKKFPERVGSGDLAHFNTVVGRTEDGDYIVLDPMHTGGPVEMSREDLAEFFADGDPDFVAWKQPDKANDAEG